MAACVIARRRDDGSVRPGRRAACSRAGLLLALGATVFPAAPSVAQRVALVIGNQDYEARSARLVNPVADARAVRDVLDDLGFAVTYVEDADKERMDRAADTFIDAIQPGAAAVFYYAGHGMELDGRNYLAPVNALVSWDAVQTRNRSFVANEVQERMEDAGATVRIVILDACRDNPFDGRSLGRGGGGAMAPRGGLVAYAAGAGQTAADDGRYAASLVEALRVPGLSLDQVFTRVSGRIARSSGGRQTPARYSSGAVGDFVLNGTSDLAPDPPLHPPPPDRARRPGEVFRDCPSCPKMVVIPEGTFRMGSPPLEDWRDGSEGPRRWVQVGSFALGVMEVTFDEWEACVRAGGCLPDQGTDWGARPVNNVSWWDAQAYVSWLSAETGAAYRLPSESEWEYAARAGTTTPFHTGMTISTNQANYNGDYIYNFGRRGTYRGETTPVGTFAPNAFGLYDVHGNVSEWVEDCVHDSYLGAPGDGTVWVRGGDCGWRVLRGGSWVNPPWELRSAARSGDAAEGRYRNVGFRVAKTLD